MILSGKATRRTRRQILASGAAMAFLPATRAFGAPQRDTAEAQLTTDTRSLEVNGKAARVFGLTGPDGKSGLTLDPGERFHVNVVNRTGASTILHWHGQLPPWRQDGFPWPQTPPIPAGGAQSYDYAPIPGTFWIHSHQGLQEQSLLTAPLIVHSAEDRQADRQEVVLMLHDFSFRAPGELLAGLTRPNGRAGVMSEGDAMTMGAGGMGAMNMAPGAAMDLNDIDYDASSPTTARSMTRDCEGRAARPTAAQADQRRVRDAVLDRSRRAHRHRHRGRRPPGPAGADQPSAACDGPTARRVD